MATTPDEGKMKLEELWDQFVREAMIENPDFFLDHKDASDSVSTFWFWLEQFALRDIGRPLMED
tara:strand:- start:1495 stop:1686 length:192 start_codon:yes stop_codon:yes gene_type:complete